MVYLTRNYNEPSYYYYYFQLLSNRPNFSTVTPGKAESPKVNFVFTGRMSFMLPNHCNNARALKGQKLQKTTV